MDAARLLKRGRPGLVASTDATDKIGPFHGLECLIAINCALALHLMVTHEKGGRRRDEEDHREPRGHLSWHVTPINDRRVEKTGHVQSPRGGREPATLPSLIHGRATNKYHVIEYEWHDYNTKIESYDWLGVSFRHDKEKRPTEQSRKTAT
ncbi:hypothetical protein PsorP6_012374 [Peronosclerospora sorghi]|uniref:Uncharacterized protein n=1 Tax=Peronosclerospora sorghi TaxID=230839 RepID=A0ACC0WH10_9STRA|nr:hypothetical protein PsorP6_012374 [Peronosclerospora sorghi]